MEFICKKCNKTVILDLSQAVIQYLNTDGKTIDIIYSLPCQECGKKIIITSI